MQKKHGKRDASIKNKIWILIFIWHYSWKFLENKGEKATFQNVLY